MRREKAAQTLEEALSCYESLGLSDSPEAVTCRNNLNLCRNAVKQRQRNDDKGGRWAPSFHAIRWESYSA